MGQAKNRGSFEERKSAAIKQNEKAYKERRKIAAEYEAAKTTEQRKKEISIHSQLASLQALCLGTSAIYENKM